MSRASDDGIILGSDTPFVPFSEAARAFGPDHRPLSFKVEGKEATRVMNATVCAMMWRVELESPKSGMEHGEFMREFIAGANHDLRALGFEPLSIAEVEALSKADEIVAAVNGSKRAGGR